MGYHFNSRRRVLVTPVKSSAVDIIQDSPVIVGSATFDSPTSYDEFQLPTEGGDVRTYAANSQSFVEGGTIWVPLFAPLTQVSTTVSGIAGKITFAFQPLSAVALELIGANGGNQIFTYNVFYAVVHVRDGQTPNIVTPYSNIPIAAYDPKQDVLTYGVGTITFSANGGQTPFTQYWNVGTKRALSQNDYMALIYSTTCPVGDDTPQVQAAYDSRMFLRTN